MKFILLAIFIAAIAFGIWKAQDGMNVKSKTDLPIQKADLWTTDYKAALTKAATEKHMVLVKFTGSDWCPPCKLQTREVFDTPEFAEFAQSKLIPVKLDFPRNIPQTEELRASNRALAEELGVNSFPTLILLDSKGGELARVEGYPGGGVEAFIEWVGKHGK